MAAVLSPKARALIASAPSLATLATLNADGSPQISAAVGRRSTATTSCSTRAQGPRTKARNHAEGRRGGGHR